MQNTLLIDPRLFAPFDAAADALARLDERLRAGPVAEAWRARADFRDACAALRGEGEIVDLADLVLHDARMDARAPPPALLRAHRIVAARRRLSAAPAVPIPVIARDSEDEAEALADFAEIDALLARTSGSPLGGAARQFERRHDERVDPMALVYDLDWDEAGRLAAFREGLAAHRALPPLLAAAAAAADWEMLDPLPRHRWLGALLVAVELCARGRTQHHLAALHIASRAASRIRRRADPAAGLVAFAEGIAAMAQAEARELARLSQARDALLRRCKGRRANSRLPALADLFIASPAVSAPFAARELGVSLQAATTMIDDLSPALRELTGRGRYRAFAVL